MLASSITCLLFGGLVSAASLPVNFARSNNATNLTANDIIVFGKNGRVEVWPKEKYEYLSSLESSAFDLTASSPLNSTSLQPSGNSTLALRSKSRSNSLESRSCLSQIIIAENEDQTFLNWDVPMSSVIHATGVTNYIQIATGYSVANAIAVTAGGEYTIAENFLSVSMSISYTYTWTTTTTSAYTFYPDTGVYAAIVANPRTLRKSGTIYEGCIGDATQATTYQGDSYKSQSWGDLAWVSGTISLCTANTYPIPACIGNKFLY